MSLISEALKKAEQQRRLGQPPDLGTPFATPRRRRSLLPFIAAAIVVALGAGAWLSLGGSPAGDAPATTAAAPAGGNGKHAAPAAGSGAVAGVNATADAARDPAAASTAAERRPVMGANAVANTNVVNNIAPPPRLNHQAPPQNNPPTVKEVAERESEPHPAGANPLAPGEAAPLALGAPPPETPVNDPEGVATKTAIKDKALAATPPGTATPASATPPTAAARQPGLGATTAAATAKAATPPPAAAGRTPTGAAAPAPIAAPVATPPPTATTGNGRQSPSLPNDTAPLEQLPAYWQLPYNVRKELPELKLSMHVYSATPAQRFVVLNGNRQVEGDELGGEVQVAEIRTDGVVLSYHGQRFLLPRGGS